MSSGKGGQQTTTVKLPKELQQAAVANLADARRAAQIGYVPYSGPTVAAFTPQQMTAFEGANKASQAFGLGGSPLGVAAGLPRPTTYAGGISGYSGKPMYDQAVEQIAPGQLQQILSFFINPQTGAKPTGVAQNGATPANVQNGGRVITAPAPRNYAGPSAANYNTSWWG